MCDGISYLVSDTKAAECINSFLRGIIITILDIIHRPFFYLRTLRFADGIISSSSGGITQLDRIEGASLCLWIRERESGLRNVVFINTKTGSWIVLEIVMVISIYLSHKPKKVKK
jgi:hypothetical protein